MAAVTVTAPVEDFAGTVAGVVFDKGRAETDNPSAIAYFRRHGYTVDRVRQVPGVAGSIDSRDATETKVGAPLRDAAVDPKPGDFLPPTNAGKADPHGPDVVSPEIHGSQGTRPVTAGEVDDQPAAQELDETVAAVEATDVDLEQPAKNASQEAWAAYAVSKGADPDEAQSLSRSDLVEQYGA